MVKFLPPSTGYLFLEINKVIGYFYINLTNKSPILNGHKHNSVDIILEHGKFRNPPNQIKSFIFNIKQKVPIYIISHLSHLIIFGVANGFTSFYTKKRKKGFKPA